ncbi:MAG: flagellar hook-basal body complex protein [Proteobacteria bacterium]|nr:flagellar hook-basal body complex protein [Pseudomonadota bacterium]
MSISSGLFSGISGLNALGNAMTVIGDNIANVNTVGFKESRVTFQDVLSQSVATTGGSAQVGRGTSLADISSSFSQGSFESTDSSTDLAIGGAGFFMVRDPGAENSNYYTRAGEFSFDKDGNFVNPSGFISQGWKLDEATGQDQGTIMDITLSSFTSSPAETSNLSMIMNLDSSSTNNTTTGTTTGITDTANNGSGLIEIEAASHGYSDGDIVTISGVVGTTEANGTWTVANATTDTFDLVGSTFVNPYISDGTSNLPNTALSSVWDGSDVNGEYIVDTDYSYQTTLQVYDSLGSTHDVTIYFDKGATATDPVWEYIVTVNPSEDLRTITDSTQSGLLARGTIEFNGTSGDISGLTDSISCELNGGDGTWTTLSNTDAIANGGYFTFTPEFIAGSPMNIKLDFGSRFNGSEWANDALSTTQFSSASSTIFQSADGYGAGDLQGITVGTDGVITGEYSNGQVLPLYRVALAKFQNEQGLYKEGGSLFSQTRLSGEPITGKPGSNGLGSLSPNSLEQSNVDLATEFVRMITTQRGYQANSKIITTIDQMLSELINLKR